MVLSLEIRSGSALSSNQSELTKTTIMTTNIWPIQPSLPKQVDTIWILYTLERECTRRIIFKCIYIYILCYLYKQAAVTHRSTTNWCRKSSDLSIQVHPFQEDIRQAGAAILKQIIIRTMDNFQNNEVDDVDGSPTRPAKLGVMLSSHIIVLPETC